MGAFELPALPALAEAEGDRHWIVGDFDGNGRDDLLRQRESGPPFAGWVAPEPPWWSSHYSRWTDPFLAHDTLIHFSSLGGDQHKGYISSSGDGLLDEWKTGRVRPGGLDLKVLGCRVGRRDVIVEIERFDSVNLELLKAEVDVTVRLFAGERGKPGRQPRDRLARDLPGRDAAQPRRGRPEALYTTPILRGNTEASSIRCFAAIRVTRASAPR